MTFGFGPLRASSVECQGRRIGVTVKREGVAADTDHPFVQAGLVGERGRGCR